MPFIIVKVFAFIWSAIFLTAGLHIKTGIDYRKSVLITVVIFAIVIIMAVLSQNFIITPIPLE